jgi:hypothetical protein
MRLALAFLAFFLSLTCLKGQNLQPTVFGNDMLCPGSTGTVSTQTYDTYQWNRRYYGSNTTQPLSGEVYQQLVMDYSNFVASFVSVTVSQGGQAAVSPEFFVDGWMFLPVFVIVSGSYTIGPTGAYVICPGDTITFELGLPYNTNIIWFRNGTPISGANAPVFRATTEGSYGVSCAPDVCPDYLQTLAVPLEVIHCTTNATIQLQSQLKLLPSEGFMHLRLVGASHIDDAQYRILDNQGSLLKAGSLMGSSIPIDDLPAGFLIIQIEGYPSFRLIKPARR